MLKFFRNTGKVKNQSITANMCYVFAHGETAVTDNIGVINNISITRGVVTHGAKYQGPPMLIQRNPVMVEPMHYDINK